MANHTTGAQRYNARMDKIWAAAKDAQTRFNSTSRTEDKPADWSGSPDPLDPDNFWIDDNTGERVNARTGGRTKPFATEPTEQGNQLVIPGCEKDKTRGPKQMDLF